MWKRHQLRTAANREEHELRYLFFEVSRRCNIHCRYCGSSCSLEEDETELKAADWIRITDQIAEDYDPERVMIAVTGGEPLFKAGIFDVFKHLHEKGFHYGMVTNSTLLNEENARRLVECGMNSISLSCDSIPEVNNSIRGAGMSRCVEKAITNLNNAGYEGILEILSTITKPCMPHLHEMQKWVMDHGIKRWRLAPVMDLGRASENRDLLLDDEDVKNLLDFIRGQRRALGDDLRLEFSEEGYLGNPYEGLVRPYLCQCRAGINVGGIRYDGKIGACPELPHEFDQGDIHESRFSEVWNSKYQLYRDRSWTKSLGPCQNCDKFKYCNGGALHLYSDMKTPANRCFYKMLEKCGVKL